MKVLIVDDSQSWNDYHYDNLSKIYKNAIINRAYSAKEAYTLVFNNLNEPYNLIITDLSMESDFLPKFAGEWFVEQIKQLTQYNSSRIFIVSGSMQIKHVAEDLGVECIPKYVIANDNTVYNHLNL